MVCVCSCNLDQRPPQEVRRGRRGRPRLPRGQQLPGQGVRRRGQRHGARAHGRRAQIKRLDADLGVRVSQPPRPDGPLPAARQRPPDSRLRDTRDGELSARMQYLLV